MMPDFISMIKANDFINVTKCYFSNINLHGSNFIIFQDF